MQRLRDLSDLDGAMEADEAGLAELTRLARAVGDLEPPPGAQDRVRTALAAVDRRSSKASWRQPVLAIAVLVTAIASLAISTVRTGARPHLEFASSTGAERRIASAAVGSTMPAGPAAPQPVQSVEIESPRETPRPVEIRRAPRVLATQSNVPPAPPLNERRVRTANRIAENHTLEPEAAGSAPTRDDEAALVLEAMRALRQAHDKQAAVRLLNEYRARFPRGDLAEEALALAIEVHAELHDPATFALADEYLQRFPQGRFRDTAGRARSNFQGLR